MAEEKPQEVGVYINYPPDAHPDYGRYFWLLVYDAENGSKVKMKSEYRYFTLDDALEGAERAAIKHNMQIVGDPICFGGE